MGSVTLFGWLIQRMHLALVVCVYRSLRSEICQQIHPTPGNRSETTFSHRNLYQFFDLRVHTVELHFVFRILEQDFYTSAPWRYPGECISVPILGLRSVLPVQWFASNLKCIQASESPKWGGTLFFVSVLPSFTRVVEGNDGKVLLYIYLYNTRRKVDVERHVMTSCRLSTHHSPRLPPDRATRDCIADDVCVGLKRPWRALTHNLLQKHSFTRRKVVVLNTRILRSWRKAPPPPPPPSFSPSDRSAFHREFSSSWVSENGRPAVGSGMRDVDRLGFEVVGMSGRCGRDCSLCRMSRKWTFLTVHLLSCQRCLQDFLTWGGWCMRDMLCLLPGNVPSRFIHMHFTHSKSRSSVKGRVWQTVNQTSYVLFN